MARIKEAVTASSTWEAHFEFSTIVSAVRRCQLEGREDIEVAVREQLVRYGVPAALLVEGTAEMGLVIQLTRAIGVATISFGLLKVAAERLQPKAVPEAAMPPASDPAPHSGICSPLRRGMSRRRLSSQLGVA